MVPKKYFGEVETIDNKLNNLADKWVFETNGHKWSNNNNEAGDNFGSFKEGYRTAQKTLYNDDEVLKLVSDWTDYRMSEDTKSKVTFKKWFEEFKNK
jgi:hypothetical protein